MKTLVDTSVWIDHFRKINKEFLELLETGQVLVHAAIIGELACGSLKNRTEKLNALKLLPFAEAATAEEVFDIIENFQLWGKGLGWIDVHLLASAMISDADLLTHDKILRGAFEKISLQKR